MIRRGCEMREIKFRGKRVDNGEWVYGDLIHRYSNWIYIAPIPSTIEITPIEIDPETVGQYTGLKDKNEKEIYEGDIISYFGGGIGLVYYDEGKAAFYIEWFKQGKYTDMECIIKYAEVIGNRWENPELLEEV
jgi:uncharacterized phage protein (TIGR01671 family)